MTELANLLARVEGYMSTPHRSEDDGWVAICTVAALLRALLAQQTPQTEEEKA